MSDSNLKYWQKHFWITLKGGSQSALCVIHQQLDLITAARASLPHNSARPKDAILGLHLLAVVVSFLLGDHQ